MKKIQHSKRKSLTIKNSGRSSDFITPSFGFGCLYKCKYCTLRRHKPDGLSIASNTKEILNTIDYHSQLLDNKTPNQTHKKYWTYDISCNEDFSLHAKFHKWKDIFDFFKYHPKVMATMATKYVNPDLCNYDANSKVRIRFSLMPQYMSSIMEPKTSKIIDRIKAINAFIDAGYDVHVNFSPVILYRNWLEDYKDLFQMLNDYVDYKDVVKAEVIFLTHNEKLHKLNVEENFNGERFLWVPSLQEEKISTLNKTVNLRYERNKKSDFINQFKSLHSSIIPWNTIRYIF